MRAIFKIDIRGLYARQSCGPMLETYRFCPACGGALEARLLKAGEPKRLVCTSCGFILYLDPKVAVGTIITATEATTGSCSSGARSSRATACGCSPAATSIAARRSPRRRVREAREEAGLDVRLDGLVNIYSYPGAPLVIIVYSATAIGGELCTDDECLEARLFPPAEIPWTELAFRSTHDALPRLPRGPDSSPRLIADSDRSRRNWDQEHASSAANVGQNRTVDGGILLAPLRKCSGRRVPGISL